MRFHLDENVDHAIAAGLRLRGVDVTTSTDAGLLGATDEQQIQFALAEGRVILTQDDDLLALASQGVAHAGIAFWESDVRTIGQVVRRAYALHKDRTPEEMAGQVQFL
jgi:uncharacterized protein with PIN domain